MTYEPTEADEALFEQLGEYITEMRNSPNTRHRWYIKGLFDGLTVASDYPQELIKYVITTVFPTEVVEDLIREIFRNE